MAFKIDLSHPHPWECCQDQEGSRLEAVQEYATDDTGPRWSEARVPGTILGSLVRNGVYPEPYVGVNARGIPDIAETGPAAYTYWFRTRFSLSEHACEGGNNCRKVWLRLRGVNYQAEVHINGNRVFPLQWKLEDQLTERAGKSRTTLDEWELVEAGLESDEEHAHCSEASQQPGKSNAVGMFKVHVFDITDFVEEDENRLAIMVTPPPHYGTIPPTGGQGGDHAIAQDVTAQYTEGWDWIISAADRNTGIWDKVSVLVSPCVRTSDLFVQSDLDLGDSEKKTNATVRASATLHNPLNKCVRCYCTFSYHAVDGSGASEVVELEVKLQGNESKRIFFDEIVESSPKLWWPNGYGDQHLYRGCVTVKVTDVGGNPPVCSRKGCIEHKSEVNFGIRSLQSHCDKKLNGRVFIVNGRRIFIRGGNWICSDGLLRLTKERYRTDLRFHRDMGLNMIRVWAGSIMERPDFFDAADEFGILVWQEFPITGDNDGRGAGDSSYPLDHGLFLQSVCDSICMHRNHPSLALWVGGNEQRPSQDLNTALAKKIIPSLDPGRLYVQGSVWGGFANGKGGNGYLDLGDGPYGIQEPSFFFHEDYYPYAFNPEIGSVGVPVVETMKRFLPHGALSMPVFSSRAGYSDSESIDYEQLVEGESVNGVWDYHKFMGYGAASGSAPVSVNNPGSVPVKLRRVRNQIALYGIPSNIDEYCYYAQLANYVQYRALMEAWGSRIYEKYTGVLVWKSANPWTGLRGQLYDWYHMQTGGYYGIQTACEPLHVQMNELTCDIEIVNNSHESFGKLVVAVDICLVNSMGRIEGEWNEGHSVVPVDVVKPMTGKSVASVLTHKAAKCLPTEHVAFVRLLLKSDRGDILSRNVYWRCTEGISSAVMSDEPVLPANEFLPLRRLHQSLGKAVLSPHIHWTSGRGGTDTIAKVAVECHEMAVFVQVKAAAKNKSTGQIRLIAPAFYDKNYVTGFEGEEINFSVEIPSGSHTPSAESLCVVLTGLNTAYTILH